MDPARRRQARPVRVPRRRRGRRDDERRAGRHGRLARPLPGARGRRRADARRARGAHRHRRRYVREWLNAQAAGGYVTYQPATALQPAARAGDRVLPTRTARFFLPGLFRMRSARCWTRRGSPTTRTAKASAGTSTTCDSSRAPSGSSAPATSPTSSTSWLPALDGVVEKLQRGARVADVGCGHGASTILMAGRFRTRRSSARTITPRRSRSPAARRDGRRGGSRALRGRARRRLPRRRLRPRGHLRLPARHGRPGRRRPARARRSPPTARG